MIKLPEISKDKNKFMADSAMKFAQYIGTAGLATKLFVDLSAPWKIGLVACMFVLIMGAIIMYPNTTEEEK